MMYNGYTNPYLQQPRTDIGQVNSEQDAINAYVAAGCSRIMFSADDKTVYVKCVSMNGQVSMDIFDRRAQSALPTAPEYVTREELNRELKALKTALRPQEKEASE